MRCEPQGPFEGDSFMTASTINQAKRSRWARLAFSGCTALFLSTGWAAAQQGQQVPPLPEQGTPAQTQALPEALKSQPIVPVTSTLNDAADDHVRDLFKGFMKEEEDKKKKAEEEKKKKEQEEGVAVGSVLSGSVRWDPGVNGMMFETPNKDFTLHIGGRMQFDDVWWTQTPALRSPTQIGNLEDGSFFRRIRIQMDGTAWEVFEFNFEYALENAQQGVVGLDEFWAGITKVPYIGSIRMGHQKVPQGLEGDMVSSSKGMTFLERAAYTDAFYQNFASGIWFGNNFFDQHMTYSAMLYRTDTGAGGNDFGDGEYAATGRLTFLPVYENEGRCVVHLGASATWREAERLGTHLSGPRVVRFAARPEQRDATGDFGNNVLQGDSVRMVDTGNIVAESADVFGAEALGIFGPFWTMAEWAVAVAHDPKIGGNPHDDFSFNGGYIQAAYFLTGENRLYDRRYGRLNTTYCRPNTPFWAVEDESGNCCMGCGAWEVAVRYSYLNLNDGIIQGGVMQGVTVGLNWYLTTNFKVQFEWVNDARWHRDGGSPPGNISGVVNGFGIRTQAYF